MTTPQTGKAVKNPNPYNINPIVGTANHTPILTPLGVSPEFMPQNQVWTWINGNQPDSNPDPI